MESLEISGKTVEEAIQHALEQLNVTRKEIEVTVLNQGKAGILGLRGEEARIRVKPLVPTTNKETNIATTAKAILETLLALLGVTASVVLHDQPSAEAEETAPIAFDVSGEDLGILIGRRGQTLTCLQYIVRLIVAHQTKTWVPIIIDVEGYRQHRNETLQALVRRMAEEVVAKGKPLTLSPMPAYERRIIHLTLADHPDVTTQSIGIGEARQVVILPKEE